MRLELERGIVQSVEVTDKTGGGKCEINCREIKLHRDLIDNVHQGEEVLLVGVYRKKVFQALALKNITRNKVSGIDCTNYVLLMGLGFILFIMFGIFGMNEEAANFDLRYMEEVVSVTGLVLIVYFIRTIIRATGAVKRVS